MKKRAFVAAFAAILLGISLGALAAEIHDAVRAGDLAKVKALVAQDPKVVNEKDDRDRTPLHFASVLPNREVLAFLIANGADVSATDPGGFTPLHWAASEGKADAARALIAAGADPNVRSAQGVSILESAFYGRRPEAVEALLQGGLKVETEGDAGRALLHRAASAGFLSLVEYLLAHGADAASKHDFGTTLLHSTAEGGLTPIAGKLIESGANVNATDDLGRTPLHLAAAAGRKDAADMLVAKGADIKAVCRDGRNLLHCAAAGGLVELMDRLIMEGFPVDGPDRYGRTPLLKAAEAGSDAAAGLLLSKGANVMSRDFFEQTPLHEAAFSGNLRLLDLLVGHGADIHAVSEEGATPLLYVSQAGRAEVIDWLLEHGARLDVRNKFNETPLTFPLGNGFVELVENLWPRAEALKNRDLLEKYPLHRVAYLGVTPAASFVLGKGFPIDLKDESGRTPFQRAAQGGSVEIAKMLLDKGAQVDAPDPEGSTPLHLAAKKGRSDMVRFLLRNKANPKAKDGKGRNALDLAAEYGYLNIAAILGEAGTEPTPSSEKTDVPSLLAKPLRDGEAIVWSLGHCGFAVKTRSRLLIFDYFSRGGRRPEKPSLANGFVDPEEIKDQSVVVFVSHAHGDHFDPVVLSWRPTVKDITFVFGWNARKGERAIDLPAPRAKTTLKGMEIFTINGEHNDVPEAAYLVKVDGLAIYHAGDYLSPSDAFRADMDYFLEMAGTIDIAFIGKYQQAEALKPRVVFPIHAYNREFMYGAFAREAAQKKLSSRVICPENKGDRFFFLGPGEKQQKSGRAGGSAAPPSAALSEASQASRPQREAGTIFSPHGRLISQGRIFSVATHDFDRDGRPDIAVSDYLNPARILYNDPGLGFKRIVPLSSTAQTSKTGHGVALGDFNGDGQLDIFLVYNEYPSRLLFGDGRGGFNDSGQAIGAPGLSGTSVDVADIDQDGDLDVFVTYYQERARLYVNDGRGSLALSDQAFFDGVATGDVDGDGDADVVSLREGGTASVWLNEKGRFVLQETAIDVGEGIARLTLVDLDGDRDLDLFALGRTVKSALWENDGRGSFRRSEQSFDAGTRLAAGDIDLDGKKDLMIGFSVWLNKGDGRFENVQAIFPGPVSALELVDLDGDGDLDLLGAGLDRATGKADLLLFLNTRLDPAAR